MSEQTKAMQALVTACWKDSELKQRLIQDPISVLTEFGVPIPNGKSVAVVENTESTIHITIPERPDTQIELSDEELESAAGGVTKPIAVDINILDNPNNPTP